MGKIWFTQYKLPDGRKEQVHIEMPDEISAKADTLIEAGYRFEIEILSTGMIFMDCLGDDDEELANRLCENGPSVVEAVKELVCDAHEALQIGA